MVTRTRFGFTITRLIRPKPDWGYNRIEEGPRSGGKKSLETFFFLFFQQRILRATSCSQIIGCAVIIKAKGTSQARSCFNNLASVIGYKNLRGARSRFLNKIIIITIPALELGQKKDIQWKQKSNNSSFEWSNPPHPIFFWWLEMSWRRREEQIYYCCTQVCARVNGEKNQIAFSSLASFFFREREKLTNKPDHRERGPSMHQTEQQPSINFKTLHRELEKKKKEQKYEEEEAQGILGFVPFFSRVGRGTSREIVEAV